MATLVIRRTPAAPAVPGDVRLMNAAAAMLVAVLLAVAGGYGWRALLQSPRFAVKEIVIDGDVTRNNVATIRANTLPRLKGNFFSIRLDAAREVFEGVPWVRHAVVRRVWPDRLAVTLEEHRPAAFWRGSDGVEKLVNDHGEVFDANLGDIDEDTPMPTLAGPDGSSAQLLEMATRLAPIVKPLEAAIERLELSGRGSWRLVLDSGAEIEIGRGSDEDVAARVERFVRTVPQTTHRFEREFVHADLRHRDGYALRLKDVITTPDAPLDKPNPKKTGGAAKPRATRN